MPRTESDIRLDIARSANFEVQLLANTLSETIAAEVGGAKVALVSRGILKRISDLSDIVFEAMFQDEKERHSIEELQSELGEKV